ncbi:MAG: hypothetical protein UT42_C0010G0001, partial [Candidatus Falkowbacteria bacterium GW2011_GWA2_39_24]
MIERIERLKRDSAPVLEKYQVKKSA